MAKIISLSRIYRRRFAETADYRRGVWRVLTSEFFERWIHAEHAVLDLGCGYGGFVNQIRVRKKWAMDLNPDTAQYLNKDVVFLQQDCAEPWQVKSQFA